MGHHPSFGIAVCASVLWAMPMAQAFDYTVADPNDADTLERSLFVCLWRSDHGVPDGAPSPVVCTTAAISTDDAVHETKQWWTYWTRFSTAGAMEAKIRFNNDFLAFQARQRQHPDLVRLLLPQADQLSRDDWRVRLVQLLKARSEAHLGDARQR